MAIEDLDKIKNEIPYESPVAPTELSKSHDEPQTQTIAEYRKSQGVEKYDEINSGWRDIFLKKRSSDPTVGTPSEHSLQLFDMCSYDIDSFAKFVQSDGFQKLFDLDKQTLEKISNDEEALLLFTRRFLKQVLFGETTIKMHGQAIDERVETSKARRARREVEKTEQIDNQRQSDFEASSQEVLCSK